MSLHFGRHRREPLSHLPLPGSPRGALTGGRLLPLLALGAPLFAACPQLRDGDFQRLPAVSGGTGGSAGNDAAGGSAGDGAAGGGALNGGMGGSDAAGASGSTDAADGLTNALAAALAHRYGFDGSGSATTDSVTGQRAALVGTQLTGTGSVALAGGGEYVDLPDGLLSAADEQTLEAWLIWNGGRSWQRIFDFGSRDDDDDGETYMFLTPRSSRAVASVSFTIGGYADETVLYGTRALPVGVLSHVAVVVDSSQDTLALYIDGTWDAATTLSERTSAIDDVNSWLGLSQYDADPSLDARIMEFRIYRRALTSDELRRSYELGPDAAL